MAQWRARHHFSRVTLAFLFADPDDEVESSRLPSRIRQRQGKDGDRSSVPDAEESWCTRLRAGDEQVLEELLDAYYGKLLRYATTIVRDEDAADIVQSVFVAVWERRETLALRSSMASYLFRAVRNAGLNHVRDTRAARIRAERAFVDHAGASNGDATADRADARLEAAEQTKLVADAIAALPPQSRDVLALRANGLHYDEIAAVLNIPLKTAQTRGRRGIALLRERLGAQL